MITCTSERSGARPAAFVRATTPHAATSAEATSTRKRLPIDQRMSAAIISRLRALRSIFVTSNEPCGDCTNSK
jgi:hypothetical protein